MTGNSQHPKGSDLLIRGWFLITAIAAGAVIIAAALITVMIIKKKGRKTQ